MIIIFTILISKVEIDTLQTKKTHRFQFIRFFFCIIIEQMW
jgi:hypothetical protein